MSVFKKIFSQKQTKTNKPALPWIELTASTQLADIKVRSKVRPQFIFKHSITCGISSMVFNRFATNYPFNGDVADLYYLDLHAYRSLSNEVSELFQVMHQSPQLLVIKDEIAVFHTSHGAILEVDLKKFA